MHIIKFSNLFRSLTKHPSNHKKLTKLITKLYTQAIFHTVKYHKALFWTKYAVFAN